MRVCVVDVASDATLPPECGSSLCSHHIHRVTTGCPCLVGAPPIQMGRTASPFAAVSLSVCVRGFHLWDPSFTICARVRRPSRLLVAPALSRACAASRGARVPQCLACLNDHPPRLLFAPPCSVLVAARLFLSYSPDTGSCPCQSS